MLRPIPYSLLLCLLISCEKQSGQEHPASNSLKTEISSAPNAYRYPVGSGYRTHTGEFISSACVKTGPQGIVAIPAPEGSLQAGFSESREVVEDRFSQTNSVSGGVGVTVDGSAEVSAIFAESNLKTTAYLTFTHRAGNIIMLDPQITPEGRSILISAAQTGVNRDLELFRGCGDEYVYQVELGSRLHIGVEYTFASNEIKSKAKASLKIEAPLGVEIVDISQSLEGPSTDKTLGAIRLVAFQEGGDQAEFKKIQAGIPASCSLKVENKKLLRSEFSACIHYFQDVLLDYAKNQFPRQVSRFDGKSGDPNLVPGLNVLHYFTRRYDRSGWGDLQSRLKILGPTEQYIKDRVRTHSDRIFALQQLRRAFDNLVGSNVSSGMGQNLDFDAWRRFRIEISRILDQQALAFKRCQNSIRESILQQRESDFPECEAARNDFDATLDQARRDPLYLSHLKGI